MHILRLWQAIAIAWSLTALACIITIGRFYIHWHRRRRLSWDDFFNGLAMAFLLAFTGTYQIYGPTDYSKQLYAMGIISADEIPKSDPSRNSKYNAANSLLFWCVVYSVKAGFLALYWPFFESSLKFRMAWASAALYTFISFGMTIMWAFWLCGEPKYFPDVQPQCEMYAPGRVFPMLIAWCVLDVVGDLFLIALPVAMLKPLLMKNSQKFELAILFSLVVISIVLSILRTVYSIDVDLMVFPDQNLLWVFLQVTISVIVCALPCYRGLVVRKKRGSVGQIRRFRTASSEFDDMWQRYLMSFGEGTGEETRRDMEQSGGTGSTLAKA